MSYSFTSIASISQIYTYTSHILVIEENEDSRYLLKTFLELNGHDVVAVENDGQYFALKQEWLTAIIILNISRSIEDGLDMLRRVRNHALLQTVPIIVTSAHITPALREEVWQAGGDAFFTKPIDLNELLKMITQCLPSRKASHLVSCLRFV